MRTENLYAVTGFANRAFLIVGGQWLGKTSLRLTPVRLQAARTPVHEDGGRDHDAPHKRSEGENMDNVPKACKVWSSTGI